MRPSRSELPAFVWSALLLLSLTATVAAQEGSSAPDMERRDTTAETAGEGSEGADAAADAAPSADGGAPTAPGTAGPLPAESAPPASPGAPAEAPPGEASEGTEGHATSSADEAAPDGSEDTETYGEDDTLQTNDVVVTARRITDPAEAPVRSFTVSEEELERQQPVSANDVIRRVPGMSVVASGDGMGLRPNYGFRGLPADRSRNVLILEDGVPVQMMPYDYPEAYISPRIERMRSVEVVSGAASIIYGPRTIGSVINFVTLQPPPELRVRGEARVGTGGYYFGFASVGNTVGDVGYLLTVMHQAFDGPRHLGLSQTDVMGRLALDMHEGGELRVKLQFYDENSTSTNIGLTTTQYQSGVLDNFAIHDRFPIRRYAAQVTHQIELGRDVTLSTTGYFNSTTRNWWRQDFLRQSAQGASVERIIDPFGNTLPPGSSGGSNDGSSVYFLNSNVGRLRQYTVAGLEPRLTAGYGNRVMEGELIAGARLHYEHGQDVDVAGASPTARTGAIQAQQSRQVIAVAAYARPTFEFIDRHLEVAPGVRVESMFSSIVLNRDVTTAGGIVGGVYQPPVSTTYDPAETGKSHLVAVIPGVSAVAHVVDELSFFAGVHRGFVPPGIRDAIVGGGRNLQLQAEWAWNYEWGARGEVSRWANYEATAFLIDYKKQVLSPSVATTTPSGEVPSGRSTSYGVQASGRVDLARKAHLGFELPLTVAYTFTQARFGSGWAPGIAGNVIPYVPKHTVSARVDFAHPVGIEAQLSVNYMSSRFTDPYNLIEPTLDGTAGVIGAQTVVNARVAYHYTPWKSTVFVEARNLLDARYITSRAPAGIQPGMTRQVFAGVRVEY